MKVRTVVLAAAIVAVAQPALAKRFRLGGSSGASAARSLAVPAVAHPPGSAQPSGRSGAWVPVPRVGREGPAAAVSGTPRPSTAQAGDPTSVASIPQPRRARWHCEDGELFGRGEQPFCSVDGPRPAGFAQP